MKFYILKKLFLIRHAKSSWIDHTLPDLERPLNSRGRENAPLMKAKDAIVIDTSVKTIDEQVDFIIDAIKSNMKGKKNE